MPRLAWRVEQLEQHTRADESRLRPYHPPRYLTSKLLAETNFWPRRCVGLLANPVAVARNA